METILAELLESVEKLAKTAEKEELIHTIFAERKNGVTRSLFWPFFDEYGKQDPTRMMVYQQNVGVASIPFSYNGDYEAAARNIMVFCGFSPEKVFQASIGLRKLANRLTSKGE